MEFSPICQSERKLKAKIIREELELVFLGWGLSLYPTLWHSHVSLQEAGGHLVVLRLLCPGLHYKLKPQQTCRKATHMKDFKNNVNPFKIQNLAKILL